MAGKGNAENGRRGPLLSSGGKQRKPGQRIQFGQYHINWQLAVKMLTHVPVKRLRRVLATTLRAGVYCGGQQIGQIQRQDQTIQLAGGAFLYQPLPASVPTRSAVQRIRVRLSARAAGVKITACLPTCGVIYSRCSVPAYRLRRVNNVGRKPLRAAARFYRFQAGADNRVPRQLPQIMATVEMTLETQQPAVKVALLGVSVRRLITDLSLPPRCCFCCRS